MMRPIRRNAVRPGDVNRIFLAGRYPASRLSLRGTCVWIFPTGASGIVGNGNDSLYIKVRAVCFNRALRQSPRFFRDAEFAIRHFNLARGRGVTYPAASGESDEAVRRRKGSRHNSAFVAPDELSGGVSGACRLCHNGTRGLKKYNKTENLSKGFTQNLEKIRIKSH